MSQICQIALRKRTRAEGFFTRAATYDLEELSRNLGERYSTEFPESVLVKLFQDFIVA